MGKENIYRYPIAPHLLSHWKREGRKGRLVLTFGPARNLLRIDYVQYRPPEYFLGQHFLGSFRLDGEALHVVERYSYHTITNNGHVKWDGQAASEEGQCACSEIVMAHEAGGEIALELIEPDIWKLKVSVEVDQSYHETDIEYYRCTGRLDVNRRELVLERSYYRDAST